MMRSIWRKEKGFTLIELLIVVAIIGILAGIAIPRISNSTNQAKENACKANLSALESALELYNFENGGYPATLDDLTPNYLSRVPTCPSEGVYNYSPTDDDGDGSLYDLSCSIHGSLNEQ